MYVSTGNIGLFAFDPATGPAEVLGNPQNDFFNPYGLAYFNGALYFAANSQELKDSSGDPSNQPWELGPAAPVITLPGDFNGDGSVDAADYVVWRANDGTQADYNTWRSDFGRTLTSGSGEANLSAVETASTPTSQFTVLATSSGSSATTSSDSIASAPIAHGVKSSASDVSPPAVVRHLLDEYFSQFPPAESPRTNRSAKLSLPRIFGTGAEFHESLLPDYLKQLPSEEFSFFMDADENKSAVDRARDGDGVQRQYLDELFDAVDPLLVAPLSE
jgi:hypothetical protein